MDVALGGFLLFIAGAVVAGISGAMSDGEDISPVIWKSTLAIGAVCMIVPLFKLFFYVLLG